MNEQQKRTLICPIQAALTIVLRNLVGVNPRCVENECAWWNIHLGCCGLIAQGMIQGLEIERQEMAVDEF